MEKERFDELVAENMKTIFGFALTRLSDGQRAEELASDIIYELLRSAPRLRSEDGFYAFMWRIAERTYADHLRAKYRSVRTETLDRDIADDDDPTPDDIVKREDFAKLRRELALLSDMYRRATVLYYMENKSCRKIAEILGVSREMVKYYLFRARKIMREGMDMDRIFGERSYKPDRFEIDFWGSGRGGGEEYADFKRRRIKGNILLAAYYAPVTAQEISIELGVSMPYIEDELSILTERRYLSFSGGKYLTNIPIFTSDCKSEIEQRLDVIVKSAAGRFTLADVGEYESEFGVKFANVNLMRWHILTFAVHFALCDTEGMLKSEFGGLPVCEPYAHIIGGEGIIWGRASDETEAERQDRINGIYNGVRSEDGRGSVIAINFADVGNAQRFDPSYVTPLTASALGFYDMLSSKWQRRLADDGYISDEKTGKPNYAVYDLESFRRARGLLGGSIGVMTELLHDAAVAAAEPSEDFAPDHIRDAARYVGASVYRFAAVERITAELCRREWLLPVSDTDKPAVFVVTEAD